MMFRLNKKIFAATLGLALLFAATTTTVNAQSFRGRMSTKEKAAVIGGGAAAGAIIGGLLGGKKGAIIGGLLGAGGGTGYVYYKGRDDDRYRRYYGVRDYRYQRNDWRFDGYRRDDRRFRKWDRDRWNRFNR